MSTFAAHDNAVVWPERLFTTRHKLTGIAALAIFLASWHFAGIRASLLFQRETVAAIWKLLSHLFPPEISPSFLATLSTATGKTVAAALAGTLLSVLFGLPFGVLATATLWRRGSLHSAEHRTPLAIMMAVTSYLARTFLGFVRAVPDLVWGLLFVAGVGLGSLAGTLALGVAYSGVLGRVYADVFDHVDSRPLEALQSTGATHLQIFLYGIWPQALPLVTAYTLYSFECCVRAASVIGFVGAGGIGYEINISMRLFDYGQVLTLLLALIGLLALADGLSHFLRGKMGMHSASDIERIPENRPSRRYARARATLCLRSGRLLLWPLIVLAVGLSFYYAGFKPETLAEAGVLSQMSRFFGGLLHLDLDGTFVRSLGLLLSQTIAIALLGTTVGMILGFVLALPATSKLIFLRVDSPGHHSRCEHAACWLSFWFARLILSVLRAVPELVWVLVCILAVGIGPFAGTIAIGLHTTGVLGKLYADTMEEVPGGPVEALCAVGARRVQILVHGVWPLAKPMLRNYTLLRWETNLRASTILGLVGGGGLGQSVYNNLQLGFYPRVSTLIILIFAMVQVSDWIGDRARYRAVSA